MFQITTNIHQPTTRPIRFKNKRTSFTRFLISREMAYKLGSDSYTSLSLLDSTPVFPNQFQNKSYFQQSKSQLYSPFFPQHSFPSMSSYPNTYPIKNPNLLSSPSIVNQLPSLLNPTPTIETSSVNKTSKDNNNSILQSKGLSNPSANEKMVHNVMTNEECKELKQDLLFHSMSSIEIDFSMRSVEIDFSMRPPHGQIIKRQSCSTSPSDEKEVND